MNLIPLTNASSPLLKKIRGLHKRSIRQKEGLFIIEGTKQVCEALKNAVNLQDILISQSFLKSGMGDIGNQDLKSAYVVDDKEFLLLSSTEHPCGIIAIAQTPVWEQESIFQNNHSLIVVADRIQDPGNLGTILRTSLAANATGIILTKGTVDPFNPKVVRSAAGALFALPMLTNLELEESITLLKKKSIQILACSPSSSEPYWSVDLTKPSALIFGNEGQGISEDITEHLDKTICIPMNPESESLNVSISAGIILFGAHQQRLLKQTSKSH